MTRINYRGYFIEFNPKPIPFRGADWDWWADGYDGAPDSHDRRCGTAASENACKQEIDELIEDLEDSVEVEPVLQPAWFPKH